MTLWRRILQRPQSLWLRKALFQVHLWAGLAIGIYVVVIGISGSALVLRPRISRIFSRKPLVAAGSAPRLSADELTARAQRAYPAYQVDNIREGQAPTDPDDVVLEPAHNSRKRIERLFDPYTGADLGSPYSAIDEAFAWLADLHDNLFAGRAGRELNGIGACLLTLLSLTGAVVWWPGVRNWRRATAIDWRARFPRFNWDLHSAVGFWCGIFVLIWGVSGIYFCFPIPFRTHLSGEGFLALLTQLHIGRFNSYTEALWTVLGLAPAVSAVTGAVMWWNRVPRKIFWRRRYRAQSVAAFEPARSLTTTTRT